MPDISLVNSFLGIVSFVGGVVMVIAGAIAVVIGMRKQQTSNAKALKQVVVVVKENIDEVGEIGKRVCTLEARPDPRDMKEGCEEDRRLEILEISRQLREYKEQRKTDAVLISSQINSVKRDADKNFGLIFQEQKKTSVFMARVDERLKYLDKENGGVSTPTGG